MCPTRYLHSTYVCLTIIALSCSTLDMDKTFEEEYLTLREAILYQIGCHFYTLCKGGRGGRSNPCVKIYVVDLNNSGGLLTTYKCIRDAGSTADLRMLWSAIVCPGLGLL